MVKYHKRRIRIMKQNIHLHKFKRIIQKLQHPDSQNFRNNLNLLNKKYINNQRQIKQMIQKGKIMFEQLTQQHFVRFDNFYMERVNNQQDYEQVYNRYQQLIEKQTNEVFSTFQNNAEITQQMRLSVEDTISEKYQQDIENQIRQLVTKERKRIQEQFKQVQDKFQKNMEQLKEKQRQKVKQFKNKLKIQLNQLKQQILFSDHQFHMLIISLDDPIQGFYDQQGEI